MYFSDATLTLGVILLSSVTVFLAQSAGLLFGGVALEEKYNVNLYGFLEFVNEYVDPLLTLI